MLYMHVDVHVHVHMHVYTCCTCTCNTFLVCINKSIVDHFQRRGNEGDESYGMVALYIL